LNAWGQFGVNGNFRGSIGEEKKDEEEEEEEEESEEEEPTKKCLQIENMIRKIKLIIVRFEFTVGFTQCSGPRVSSPERTRPRRRAAATSSMGGPPRATAWCGGLGGRK